MSSKAGPKNPQYKTVISVLVTDKQYQALRLRVRREGRSLSGHLRVLLIEDLEHAGLYDQDDDITIEDSIVEDEKE